MRRWHAGTSPDAAGMLPRPTMAVIAGMKAWRSWPAVLLPPVTARVARRRFR